MTSEILGAVAIQAIVMSGLMIALPAKSAAESSTEFVWTDAPFPRAHASTIVESSDGTLISAWFGGSGEGNADVGVWTASKSPGSEWTPPLEIFKEPKQPAWNPVLFRDSKDDIWLFFKIGPNPMSWTGAYMKSTDSGKTWTDVVWLPAGMGGPVRNKPITLANGSILAGTSIESYGAWSSWMEISEDGGETWKKYGPILWPTMEENRLGSIQPTLLETGPNVVRAFFRTRGMGKIATALSKDGGMTWSELSLTDLDHPGAGIDAVRMNDGRCVLIYNPATRGRNPLAAAVSHDGGETWEEFLEIERLVKGERGELSYPNVIQSANGDIHISYTWKRQRIRHATIPLADVPVAP